MAKGFEAAQPAPSHRRIPDAEQKRLQAVAEKKRANDAYLKAIVADARDEKLMKKLRAEATPQAVSTTPSEQSSFISRIATKIRQRVPLRKLPSTGSPQNAESSA